MPVWLQVVLGVVAASTPLTVAVINLARKVSHTNQHFDPASPVALSIGTVPDRLKGLSEKIERQVGSVLLRLDQFDQHMTELTIVWRPNVETHQARQDQRLDQLEGT